MVERTLVLLRHAKSDWSGDEPDLRRGLAKRGRRQAPEAGQWLAAHLDRVDLAVVSPATRARRTWKLAADQLDPAPPVRVEDDVYAATDDELLGVVRGLDDDLACVVLVGHNPGLEELASRLAGRWVAMPTSALAVFALSGGWRSASVHTATLRASGRPPAPSS